MKFNISIWLTLIVAILLHITILQVSATTEIYISKQIISPAPDGSREKPFPDLSTAFDFVQNLTSSMSEVMILLAPSIETYSFDNQRFSAKNKYISSITISTWNNESADQSQSDLYTRAALEFNSSSIEMDAIIQFSITDIDITCLNSSIIIRNSNFLLQNVSIDASTASELGFIRLENTMNATLISIEATLLEPKRLFHYYNNDVTITPEILLQNISVIYTLNQGENDTSIDLSSVFNFEVIAETPTGNLNIKDVTVLMANKESETELQPLAFIKGFSSVQISNTSINNALISFPSFTSFLVMTFIDELHIKGLKLNSNQMSSFPYPLVYMNNIRNLAIDDIDCSSNVLRTTSIDEIFTIVNLVNVANVKITDNSIYNNSLGVKTQIYRLSSIEQKDTISAKDITLEVNGLDINNNKNLDPRKTFNCIYFQKATLKNLTIQNIRYSQNHLTGKTFHFENNIASKRSDLGSSLVPISFKFMNVAIVDNLATSNTNFLYFVPIDDQEDDNDCLQPGEIYLLQVNNLTVSGNKFLRETQEQGLLYKVSLFHVRKSQVHLNSSVVRDNSFKGYSFLTLGPKPASMFITSSQFINNDLALTQFIMATIVPGYSCAEYEENTDTSTLTPLYRYSFIINSTFSSTKLYYSVLFTLNNGFLAFHNNTLNNLTLLKSQLLTVNFLPNQLEFNPLVYLRNNLIENLTLKEVPIALEIFREVLNKAKSYQEDTVYFASIYQNQFLHVNFSNGENLKTISLSGLNFNQAFINIEDNYFYDLLFKDDINSGITSVIYSDSVKVMTIINNSFDSIDSAPIFFSLSQTNTSNVLIAESNTVSNFQGAVFIIYTGSTLIDFRFNSNAFDSVSMSVGLLNLNVKLTSNDWSLNNNSLTSTALMPNSRAYQADQCGLFIIYCGDSLDHNRIIWSNTTFLNISTALELKGVLLQSDIIVLQTKQSLHFVNFTVKKSNILNPGSLIYVDVSSSFTMTDSVFESIINIGSNGLVRLLTSKIVISNCSFVDYLGFDTHGIIKIVPNVPVSEVMIHNSSFERVQSNRYGSILTVQNSLSLSEDSTFGYTSSDELVYQYVLLFEMSRCSVIDSDSVIYLSNVNCSNCSINDVLFKSKDYSSMINLSDSTKGELTFNKVTFSTSNDSESAPFIWIKSSSIRVTLDSIVYAPNSLMPYLVSIDSGSLVLRNSVFQNFLFLGHGLIQIVRNMTLFSDDGASAYDLQPYVLLQNITFHNVSYSDPLNFDGYSNDWPPTEISSIIYVLTQATILVKGCTFSKLKFSPAILYNATTISPSVLSSVTLENSVFKGFIARSGAAVSILPHSSDLSNGIDTLLTIENCTFEENSANVGGAILAYETFINVSNSSFVNNSALGVGNSIFMGSSRKNSKIISQNAFLGSIDEPDNFISSEPVDFKISFFSDNPTGISSVPSKTDDGWSADFYDVSYEISQGIIILDFIDADSNPAFIRAFKTKIAIHIDSNKDSHLPTIFEVSNTGADLNTQNYSLADIVVGRNDGEPVIMVLEFESERFRITKNIRLHLRKCLPGEYDNSVTCEPCVISTYSLLPHLVCTDCPANANCLNQSRICPREGFWNANDQSTTIYKCLPDRCPNSKDSSKCAEGYIKPLCNACNFNESYVENGYLKCGKCSDPNKSLVLSILAGIGYLMYQLFSIYILYTGSMHLWKKRPEYLTTRKAERLYYVKSLLTYTQLISILYMSNYEVYNNLGLTLQVGNPSTLVTYGT